MESDRSVTGSPPAHIAVVMDGNGRWALERGLSRGEGHFQGALAARKMVELCLLEPVPCLTLFAFSSENWNRPASEVELLMDLFARQLEAELPGLIEQNIRLRVVGSRQKFPAELIERINQVEQETANGTALSLQVAADYGGRWDITQATQLIAQNCREGLLEPDAIDESTVADALALASFVDPDLLIRTGGERRMSNFLLWQCAYSELYFSDVCWPDFGPAEFRHALDWYAQRSRRFGQTQEQLNECS